MNAAEQVIAKYVAFNYGDLISPEEPKFDPQARVWRASLKSVYPRIVDDEATPKRIVKFLRLRDLGTVQMNEKLEVTEATSSEDCDEQLVLRIDLWKHYAEQIVTSGCSDAFAKIAEGIHVLNPLKLVLDQIAKTPLSGLMLTENEIEKQDRSEKIREYLGLLEEMGIVRKVEGGFGYGNALAMLPEFERQEPKDLSVKLMSTVIKEKYPTLRQVFRITQLERFIQLTNSYYWPALEADKMVTATHSSLYRHYQFNYPDSWMSEWEFESKLSDLERYSALVEDEKGYLRGNEEFFGIMREHKFNDAILNP